MSRKSEAAVAAPRLIGRRLIQSPADMVDDTQNCDDIPATSASPIQRLIDGSRCWGHEVKPPSSPGLSPDAAADQVSRSTEMKFRQRVRSGKHDHGAQTENCDCWHAC